MKIKTILVYGASMGKSTRAEISALVQSRPIAERWNEGSTFPADAVTLLRSYAVTFVFNYELLMEPTWGENITGNVTEGQT